MAIRRNILILGGSGRVGQQVINDALSRGHKVTALIRTANSIPPQRNLTAVTGSPTSHDDILRALKTIANSSRSSLTKPNPPQKVTIISTLGQTRANPSNPWSAPTSPALLMAQSAQAVATAITRITPKRTAISKTLVAPEVTLNVKVDKFIVLCMFGAGDSHPYLHWSLKLVMAHSSMQQTLDDHNHVIDIVRRGFGASGEVRRKDGKLPVPFVLVRPVMLKFEGLGTVPAMKEHGSGEQGMSMRLSCDVRSLSGWMLDSVVTERWDGQMPVISN